MNQPSHHNNGMSQAAKKSFRRLHRMAIASAFSWRWPFIRRQHICVVIGHSMSGKSQLIQNFSTHIQLMNPGWHQTHSLECPVVWQEKSTLWIEHGIDPNTPRKGTQFITKQLGRWRWLLPVTSVIVTVDLSSLYTMSTTSQSNWAQNINLALQDFEKINPKLRLHVVCTRSDLIRGFEAFFQHGNPRMRSQAMGIQLLDQNQKSKPLAETLDAWIDSLNTHLLSVVTQETSLHNQQLIQDFPKQMTVLKVTLMTLFQALLAHAHLYCDGIYFCSNEQKSHHIDYLAKHAEQSFALHNPSVGDSLVKHHCYFTKGIRQMVEATRMMPSLNRLLAFLFACSILATSHMTLLLVDAISGQSGAGTQGHQSYREIASNNITSDLQALSSKMNQCIHHQLQTAIKQRSLDTYNYLLIYLMLSGEMEIEQTEFSHWLNHDVTHNNLSKQELMSLSHFINQWRKQGLHIPLNPQIIEQSLSVIKQQAADDVIFRRIERNHLQTANNTTNLISKIYTIPGYQKLTQKTIPETIHHFHRVMHHYGTIPSPSSLDKQLLAIKERYAKAYTAYWHKMLIHNMPHKPQNMADAVNSLSHLSQPTARWLKILRTVIDQTCAEEDDFFEANIASNFRPLAFYYHNTAAQTVIHLNQLESQLDALQHSPMPHQAAFQLAKSIAINQAPEDPFAVFASHLVKIPEPMRAIFAEYNQAIWLQVLKNGMTYINQQWQQEVYHGFHAHLSGRFPLDPEADDTIGADTFQQYFGPSGILATFFNRYIEPFAIRQGLSWQWKNLHGENLPMAQSHLDWFTRANLIQLMFFNANGTQSNTFRIAPTGIPDAIASVAVASHDQVLDFTRTNQPDLKLAWPSFSGPFSITVTDKTGDQTQVKYEGHWALFRLLQAQHALYDTHTGQLHWNLHHHGKSIPMQLSADSPIHPFIPNILTAMHLDEKL